MENPINSQITDTRDLQEYLDYLESEILDNYMDWAENHNSICEEGSEIEIPDSFEDIEFIDEEAFTITCESLIDEYNEFKSFCDELSDYSSDYQYGEAVIHENYFQEYCEEFCKDVGYLSNDLPYFIERHIDWGGVADEMAQDYTTVSYQGSDYLIR